MKTVFARGERALGVNPFSRWLPYRHLRHLRHLRRGGRTPLIARESPGPTYAAVIPVNQRAT